MGADGVVRGEARAERREPNRRDARIAPIARLGVPVSVVTPDERRKGVTVDEWASMNQHWQWTDRDRPGWVDDPDMTSARRALGVPVEVVVAGERRQADPDTSLLPFRGGAASQGSSGIREAHGPR